MATISGKIISFMETQEGTTERGSWKKGGFVIMPFSDNARPAALVVFGEERVSVLSTLKVGDVVQAVYEPESREYAGKWFTDLRCFKILRATEIQR